METPARKKMEQGRVRFPDRLRFAFLAAGIAALLLALPGLATGGAVGPAHLVANLDPGISPFDPAVVSRFSSTMSRGKISCQAQSKAICTLRASVGILLR